SRLFARGPAEAAAPRELRRFRLRQPAARAGGGGAPAYRRDLLPDLVSRRCELDRLLALGALRPWRSLHLGSVPRVALRARLPAHLPRPARGPSRGGFGPLAQKKSGP